MAFNQGNNSSFACPSKGANEWTSDTGSRRQRIAQLLHKAILQTEVNDAIYVGITPPEEGAGSASQQISLEPLAAERVVQFLRVTGAASPSCIRNSLGLSRSGAFRILQALAHSRRIVTHGQTRTLVYHLNESDPPRDIRGLN